MSQEIRYIGGSMDGIVKRVRSRGDQKSTKHFVWREFSTGTNEPTGRERHEIYKFNGQTGEYIFEHNQGCVTD